MELLNFSVTNFRSITRAYKIPFSDLTVLVGKNNEGKSNLLKALNIAMSILRYHAIGRRLYRTGLYRRNNETYYYWERDFPISIQNRNQHTDTIFRLEFKLSDTEIQEFRNEIKSNLNGTLPIEIKIGKNNTPSIKVIKKGKGAKTLNSKSQRIAEYIAKRISFNYIPAIRTDQESIAVVNEMLSNELETLENLEEYKKAIATIKDLQTPILKRLSDDIKKSLKEFIPNIKQVEIEIQESRRRIALRQQFDIIIDDGNRTNLEFKGDGVKSLAALALLKHTSENKSGVSLIAIEEPESHLHPGAIHILRDTIYELSQKHQVIISTHNPLFVDRQNIKANIIIENGKASQAKEIKEIRNILGVKASDNLLNANYVLLVEGEEDVIALKSILPYLSEKIKKAIKSNLLVIEKIGGTGNLSYKLSLLHNALCSVHVLLDNDEAGRKAFEKAKYEDNLKLKDCTFIMCKGMPDSEFEDTLNSEIYENAIYSTYGVDIKNDRTFKSNKKWSDRMEEVFNKQGKPWNDKIEAEVKTTVANTIKNNLEKALNPHKKDSIDALVENLEKLINKSQ